jgi:hypothetical protein
MRSKSGHIVLSNQLSHRPKPYAQRDQSSSSISRSMSDRSLESGTCTSSTFHSGHSSTSVESGTEGGDTACNGNSENNGFNGDELVDTQSPQGATQQPGLRLIHEVYVIPILAGVTFDYIMRCHCCNWYPPSARHGGGFCMCVRDGKINPQGSTGSAKRKRSGQEDDAEVCIQCLQHA